MQAGWAVALCDSGWLKGHQTLLAGHLSAAPTFVRQTSSLRWGKDHGMSQACGTFPRMNVQGAPVSVTIKDQSGAGKVTATVTLDGIDSRITVRDLIRTRVREEVARYNAASTDIFHGPVMPDEAEPTPDGYRMPRRRHLDWEKQADNALHAFARNGFFVLVGGRQVTDPDEILELTADTDIRFIRLVQLVGG
jgi:hypothetical protein